MADGPVEAGFYPPGDIDKRQDAALIVSSGKSEGADENNMGPTDNLDAEPAADMDVHAEGAHAVSAEGDICNKADEELRRSQDDQHDKVAHEGTHMDKAHDDHVGVKLVQEGALSFYSASTRVVVELSGDALAEGFLREFLGTHGPLVYLEMDPAGHTGIAVCLSPNGEC